MALKTYNKTKKYSFKGWNIKEFLKGRKKLVVAVLGYAGGWIVTKDPALAGVVAAGSELIVACLEYYVKG